MAETTDSLSELIKQRKLVIHLFFFLIPSLAVALIALSSVEENGMAPVELVVSNR